MDFGDVVKVVLGFIVIIVLVAFAAMYSTNVKTSETVTGESLVTNQSVTGDNITYRSLTLPGSTTGIELSTVRVQSPNATLTEGLNYTVDYGNKKLILNSTLGGQATVFNATVLNVSFNATELQYSRVGNLSSDIEQDLITTSTFFNTTGTVITVLTVLLALLGLFAYVQLKK